MRAALDLAPEAVADLGRRAFGEPNGRLSTARALRFGQRGSVAVDLARGCYFDHEAGRGGGLRELARLAGEPMPRQGAERAAGARERARREQVALARRTASARRLWSQTGPLAGTVAEVYLRQARAIDAPPESGELRFHSAAPIRPLDPHCGETAAAMVARVSDAAGRGIGAHLTYLRRDGLDKADLAQPRKCVGAVGGGMVRLVAGSRLIVAEGIETALAAWEARPVEAADFGAIAAISAGGMARLAWPARTVDIVIAPDRDANGAGEEAALALAARAYAAGLAVGFMRPPEPFGDWNDVARAGRATR